MAAQRAFESQVAVVTGGSSGIGEAIALELASQGAELFIIGRNRQRLEQVAAAAEREGKSVTIYRGDLTDDAHIAELKREVGQKFNRLDILIHSAGAITLGSVESTSLGDFDHQFRTNVRAPYALTQALLPMLKSTRGQVVFINSSAGVSANANAIAYSASKHALKGVADALRLEVNGDGVRVLSLFVGRTATPLQALVCQAEKRSYRPERLIQPSDVARLVGSILALPRTAEVTDVSMRPMAKPAG